MKKPGSSRAQLPEDGMLLAEHDPNAFRTRQIRVEVENGQLSWQPVGPEISFPQMQRLRAQGCPAPEDVDNFSATVANVGVSVRLEVSIAGEPYLLLVPQQGIEGEYLKLVSGYVPVEQLDNPLATVLEEISQELLLFNEAGKVYRFSSQGQPLATPYPLQYGDTLQLSGPDQPQQWYLHPVTNSLQLVWHFSLELPERPRYMLYTEERLLFSGQKLETRLYHRYRTCLISLHTPLKKERLSEYFQHFPLPPARY